MSGPASVVANLSTLFGALPWWERPGAAARAGYRAVESWWPFDVPVPSDTDLETFTTTVRAAGVELVALNLTLGTAGADERGILSHPARVAEFAEHVDVVAALAHRLGVRLFCAPYGLPLPGVPPEVHRATAVDNLVHACARLAPLGGTPMLEPLSGLPSYPLRTPDDAVRVMDEVDARTGAPGSVGLLADLYHWAAEGLDVEREIDAHADRIVHVQLADRPGRHEPGTGRADLAGFVRRLRGRGYTGRVAWEFFPLGAGVPDRALPLPG